MKDGGDVSNLDTSRFSLIDKTSPRHFPRSGGIIGPIPRRREPIGGTLPPGQAVFELVEWFYFRVE